MYFTVRISNKEIIMMKVVTLTCQKPLDRCLVSYRTSGISKDGTTWWGYSYHSRPLAMNSLAGDHNDSLDFRDHMI